MARAPWIVFVGIGAVAVAALTYGPRASRSRPRRAAVAMAPSSQTAAPQRASTTHPVRARAAAARPGVTAHRGVATAGTVSSDANGDGLDGAAEFRAAIVRAESAWTAAEHADDAAAWDEVADQYAQAVALCPPGPRCVDPAYAEAVARKNAMQLDEPEPPPGDDAAPLPPRVDAFVGALDRFVALAPDHEDAHGMRFLGARTIWKFRHDDDAIARLEATLARSGTNEVTEYAANILLDLLARRTDLTRLRATTAWMRADAARFRQFPELWERLAELP